MQFTFAPRVVVDGTFLTDTAGTLYATGRYNHATIMLGSNRDEGTLNLVVNPEFMPYLFLSTPPPISRDMFSQLVSNEVDYFLGEIIVEWS